MPNKQVTHTGTNRSGNDYRSYNDGSYAYTNQSGGRYYNDGGRDGGNGFYHNSSKGYSSYTRSDGSGWSQFKGSDRTPK
uniref:Uncharacterized protein n=1 Tax=Chromera velia CCMP2878 TaxID=1169474 RepID=A0A0G4FES9_9ALVE|eukprot:Cvel_16642.t1-p1 / transcript=Cvel_16642.t1 / gene=Cvel_16642 / organism=Chromera_velia_CCMP2878 / gene_product=hypothetical protein / transcript_product=hypothetical protein / location=Cvel_scaffold1290:30047-30280(+) / protein_length=78 / sequence_SO=supercontig / SO=protein_coding / is_pseudo=false